MPPKILCMAMLSLSAFATMPAQAQTSNEAAHHMEMDHGAAAKRLTVAVLLYDGVEEIDYAGSIEVFGASGFEVFTVGQTKAPVTSIWAL